MDTIRDMFVHFDQTGEFPDLNFVKAWLLKLGFRLNNLPAPIKDSLNGYTRKKRGPGLAWVMDRAVSPLGEPLTLEAHDGFVSSLIGPNGITTWGVPIMPTEATGNFVVPPRRFLEDVLAHAAGCMDTELFERHLRYAWQNGIVHAHLRHDEDPLMGLELGKFLGNYPLNVPKVMLKLVTPTSNGQLVYPAAIPPGYPVRLADWLLGGS